MKSRPNASDFYRDICNRAFVVSHACLKICYVCHIETSLNLDPIMFVMDSICSKLTVSRPFNSLEDESENCIDLTWPSTEMYNQVPGKKRVSSTPEFYQKLKVKTNQTLGYSPTIVCLRSTTELTLRQYLFRVELVAKLQVVLSPTVSQIGIYRN